MNFNTIFDYLTENKTVLLPIAILLFVVLFVSIIYFFSTKQQIIRILSKLPIKRISSLRNNEFSRVTGKAITIKEPLIAPLSRRKCVFYQIKIEQETGDDDNSSWKTLIDEERFQEFYIDQNGDYLMVKLTQNPKNFTVYLVVDKETKSGTFKDASPKFEALLNQYDLKSTGFFGLNKQLRYKEAIIEIGENITVAGTVRQLPLETPIEGYSYSKITALQSTDKQKLIITDLPNIKSRKRF